jgi:hypothetical protein
MSRWTTLPLILTLSLILLSLSAEVAAAGDDLPRNIELKLASLCRMTRRRQIRASQGRRRARSSPSLLRAKIQFPPMRAESPIRRKKAKGPRLQRPRRRPLSRRRTTRQLRQTLHPPEATRLKRPQLARLRLDPLPSSSSLTSSRLPCKRNSSGSAAIPAISMACGAGGHARRSRRSAISPRSMSLSFRQRRRSSL